MTNINEFIAGWKSHRNVLHDMLADATTEQLSYKPWEKGMSLAELVLHITGAMDMFAKTVQNGVYTPGAKPAAPSTIEELKITVATATEQTEAVLRSLTPEQLAAPIDFFGNSLPGLVLLQNAKDHEIHHKGQLFVYLRLVGIEKLPFFVSKG
ncbi:DinB family protein [Paenibacillus sp. JDR-2]|uniref:DinB family protein n=1 Tax=Paenibacillus sp. (strain JDR-2) TaxID=324057 RepID=UPI000166A6C1|nr:DinB family protein [Paenibacillus sp. JDR-2]ACT00478.1 DinB family protein [Paenibacillus sp. JDR-2]